MEGYLREEGSEAVAEMAALNSFYKYQRYVCNDNGNVQMFSVSVSHVRTNQC